MWNQAIIKGLADDAPGPNVLLVESGDNLWVLLILSDLSFTLDQGE